MADLDSTRHGQVHLRSPVYAHEACAMNKETSLTVPEDALRIVRDYVRLLWELSNGPHAVVCGPVHDSSSDIDFGVFVTGTDPLSPDKAPVWAKIGERSAYWTSKGYVIGGVPLVAPQDRQCTGNATGDSG